MTAIKSTDPGQGTPGLSRRTATRQLTSDVTARNYRRSYIGESVTFERDRERVLGGLWWHRDPSIAADLLAERLGGLARAEAWVDALREELERRWTR